MKVMIGLSGGVDSAMSAKYLLESGYEVAGCYFRLFKDDKYHEKNLANARKVADFLGIELFEADFSSEFARRVYEPFVASYERALTPNPCAHCNRHIKFGAFWDFARERGCEKIATGHYARIEGGLLAAAFDERKDQSYFLANIDPAMLGRVIFPLGERLKSQIKFEASQIPQIAALASQKESSEICFVPRSYLEILSRHFDTHAPGLVRNSAGEVVGRHDGYMNFTIGKRKGFTYDGAHEPHYVLAIDPERNDITVGEKEELATFKFETKNFNDFLGNDSNLNDGFNCFVKVRYRSRALPCRARRKGDGLSVELLEPAYGIARGQLAAFYNDKNQIIGSGFIS